MDRLWHIHRCRLSSNIIQYLGRSSRSSSRPRRRYGTIQWHICRRSWSQHLSQSISPGYIRLAMVCKTGGSNKKIMGCCCPVQDFRISEPLYMSHLMLQDNLMQSMFSITNAFHTHPSLSPCAQIVRVQLITESGEDHFCPFHDRSF